MRQTRPGSNDNPQMFRTLIGGMLAVTLAVACSPVFNWREVRLPQTELKAWLPCKPDQGSRTLPLAGRDVAIHMLGCEAGGALYAVSQADVGMAGASAVQAQWQAALLANLQAPATQVQPWVLKPTAATTPPALALQLQATGKRADGRAVQAQAVWFARGPWLFHAVVYADRITPEMAEPFFSGLELP